MRDRTARMLGKLCPSCAALAVGVLIAWVPIAVARTEPPPDSEAPWESGLLGDLRRADAVVGVRMLSQRTDSSAQTREHSEGEEVTVARVEIREVFKGRGIAAGERLTVRTSPDGLHCRTARFQEYGWDGYGLEWLPEDGEDVVLVLRTVREGTEVFRAFSGTPSTTRAWCAAAAKSPSEAALRLTEILCRESTVRGASAPSSWYVAAWDEWYRFAPWLDRSGPAYREIIDRFEATAINRARGESWSALGWLAQELREPARRRLVGELVARCDSANARLERHAHEIRADSIRYAEALARATPAERKRMEAAMRMLDPPVNDPLAPEVRLAWIAPNIMEACLDSAAARRRVRAGRPLSEEERATILARAREWSRPGGSDRERSPASARRR